MKKLIKEISVIVAFAVVLAFAYNFFVHKMPLTGKKEVAAIPDSLLFDEGTDTASPVSDAGEDTVAQWEELAKQDTTTEDISKVDTSKPNEKSTEEADIDPEPEQKPAGQLADPQEQTVTFEQMLKITGNPNFVIIDARHPDQYAKDKIGDAINIFPYDDEHEIMPKIFELPDNKTIVIYCDGGTCDSSHKLADLIMQARGFDKVFIYSGGWEEWIKKKES
ncbi:MAG: rhodanese-like domain-containing protein [Candidatus Kapaibacterium sp.]